MFPREYFDLDFLRKLKDIVALENPAKIFLVRGEKSYRSPGARETFELLSKSYQILEFYDFEVNPKIEDVVRGVERFREFKPDLVIAIGGGSVLDMAKSVNLLSAQSGQPEEYITRKKEIEHQGKKLIAIPTTAGSGSEATRYATIYLDKTKYSLTHDYLLPYYVLIDPRLTFSLSERIAAESGADALSQAIESYWSVNSTEESKSYSREAIRLITDNLPLAIKNSDEKARMAMSKASYLAGKAINISQTTACHALSYPMTSYFNVSHGHAAALTLSNMIVHNGQIEEKDNLDKRGLSYVKGTISELNRLLGASDVHQAKKIVDGLIEEVGLETRLGDLGIDDNGVEIILKNVNLERMKNNPRKLSEEQIKSILTSIR